MKRACLAGGLVVASVQVAAAARLDQYAAAYEWAVTQKLMPTTPGDAGTAVRRGEFVESMMLAALGPEALGASECLARLEPLAVDVAVTQPLHPFLCLAVEAGMLRDRPDAGFYPQAEVSVREAARAYVRLVGAEKVRDEQAEAAPGASAPGPRGVAPGGPAGGAVPPAEAAAATPVMAPPKTSPPLLRAELAALLHRLKGPTPAPADVAVPILFFHHIQALPADHPHKAEYELSLAPDRLEAMLKFLRSEAIEALTFDQLERIRTGQAPPPARAVMLTFDDGYKDNFTEAFRLLERYQLKGNFSVVTSTIGRDERHMSWDDLKVIAAAGHQLSSHTHTHPDLRAASDKTLRRELTKSKRLIEERTGQRITSLVYPAGRVDDRVVAAALEAGYTLARTTRSGRRLDLRDPMRLPGVRTFPGSSVASLRRWLGPAPKARLAQTSKESPSKPANSSLPESLPAFSS